MAKRQLSRKVVVVGAGSVGCSYAYALMQTGLANEIVLIDKDRERAEGEVMDLSHGLPFTPPTDIRVGDYDECSEANMVVVTAGAKQKPGESRLNLMQRNADIVRSICDEVNKHTQDAVMVMVTNPVDILTYVAIKHLNWDRGRVIGSGTVLDTARFRFMLSEHCDVDPRNVHAYILGEHGDSEIAAWSMAHIGGVKLKDYCPRCKGCDFAATHGAILEQVRNSAYHIIDYKGATYYGIGLSLVRISSAILRNEQSVLTVSMLLEGEYGLNDVCLSLPCIVGRDGVTELMEARLEPDEQKGLENSAAVLHDMLDQLNARQPQPAG